MDRVADAAGISMALPAAIRAMHDRSSYAVIDGRPDPIRELERMFWIERDAVWSEMQCTADEARCGEIAAQRIQVKLEEMPAQAFDIDVTGQCQRGSEAMIGRRYVKHGVAPHDWVQRQIDQDIAFENSASAASSIAKRGHRPRASGFVPARWHKGPEIDRHGPS